MDLSSLLRLSGTTLLLVQENKSRSTLDKNVSTSGIAALGAFHEEGALGGQIQVMSLVSAVDEGLEKKDTEDRSLLRKQSKSFCN